MTRGTTSPKQEKRCITKHHKYLICAWSTRISLLVRVVLLKEMFIVLKVWISFVVSEGAQEVKSLL